MNFIRTKVSGKRKRFTEDGYDLDITYITERILAMSFPAAGFVQKMYRNNIVDVAKFLHNKHGDKYKIFNMSGIEYDTSAFNG